jgi:phosphinothricin acetyltransferase
VTQPNEASNRLHRAIGMELVGVYRSVGFKAGAWYDVAWYEMRLTSPPSLPEEPIPLPELVEGQPTLLAQSDGTR